MKKDKYAESESAFKKRLGIDYYTESRYTEWSKKVRSDFKPTDFRISYSKSSYVDYGRSFKYLKRGD